MSTYILKSTICLFALYGLYRIFLLNISHFNFNRFYLILSLIFSLVLPFINIPVNTTVEILPEFKRISSSTLVISSGNSSVINSNPFNFQLILLSLYSIVAIVLLFRFGLHIFKLSATIRKNMVIPSSDIKMVLVSNPTVPYSFLNYVFLNKEDYENGNIGNELICHEIQHVRQFHTIDVLIIELIQIVFWFNPILLFYRKSILLNHEFLADKNVLKYYNLETYLDSLTSFVFRNNSTYLASNLNYSLTKKRLKMITSNTSTGKAAFKKIAVTTIFLLVAATIIFSQNESQNLKGGINHEWWKPIVKKHGLQPGAYNNYDRIFESGSKSSVENGISTIENALFIINHEKDKYIIVKSKYATHHLKNKTINFLNGNFEEFSLNSKDTLLVRRGSFQELDINLTDERNEASLKAQNQLKKEQDLLKEKQEILEQQHLKYEEEQKAAMIDRKLVEEEQKILKQQQMELREEQKAAEIDQKLIKEEQKALKQKQENLQEKQKATVNQEESYEINLEKFLEDFQIKIKSDKAQVDKC